MKTGKMLGYIAVMTLIGAVLMAALAALVQWRIGTPLAATSTAVFALGTADEPLMVMREGLNQSASIALNQLRQNHRTEAVKALDAAKRAADVASYAAGGELADYLEHVHLQVRHARASLHDAQPARAMQILANLSDLLALSPTSGRSQSTVMPANLKDYVGAHVINAQGVRMGEVQRVQGTNVTVLLGTRNDILGFIDLGGGKELNVAADQLVYGKKKTLGSTMVALPTLSASPEEVQVEFFYSNLGA